MQTVQNPFINLCGEKIALGPLRSDLVPLYYCWMNDFEVARTASEEVRPLIHEQAQDYYANMSRSQRDIEFTIFLPIDGDMQTAQQWWPIGNAGLHGIDHLNRNAEFGITIAEKDCWSKGYGTETARLLLDYGFHILALHNISLLCYASNKAGITAYERAGFKHAALMHACRWADGKLDDLVLMDCLASEFGESRVLPQLRAGQAR